MINIDLLKENMKIKELNLIQEISYYGNITSSTKMDFIDNKGYKYYLSQQNIISSIRKNGVLAKFFNGNIYTYDNILNYISINKLSIHVENFNNCKNAKELIDIKCLKHNIIFKKNWNDIKNGIIGCEECTLESASNRGASRAHTIDYIKKVAFDKYNIIVTSDAYINNNSKMSFICPNHLEEGVQYKTWGNIISKKNACVYCSTEEQIKKTTKTHEQFLEDVKNVHSDKYVVITKYSGCNNKVDVYCKECGQIFSIRPSHLIDGHGCGICTKSQGELKIKEYLDSNHIQYIREYRFDNCKGITNTKTLPFDFYLDKHNILIEFQGVQHYKPVEIFGGENALRKQQANDNIKKQYCKSVNIKLLEIPYWDFDNIENILNKEVI